MKLSLALMGSISMTLAACSDASSGASPEAIATFIAIGIKDQAVSTNGPAEFRVQRKGDNPLTLRLSATTKKDGAATVLDITDIVTTKQTDCAYTFEMQPLVKMGDAFKVVIDFKNLTSATIGQQDSVSLEGASISCLPGDSKCNVSDDNKAGRWQWRIGNGLDPRSQKERQDDLDKAVKEFRQTCSAP